MAAVSSSPGIFQEARSRVTSEIRELIESLNSKKDSLVAEINRLETEFLGKQKEKETDITKLDTLITHTEELGQNTLLNLQQRVLLEMRQEMDKLKLDCKQEPSYRISVKWGFTKEVLVNSINSSAIELADCLELSDDTESSEENTGLISSEEEYGLPQTCVPLMPPHNGYRDTPLISDRRYIDREEREERVPRYYRDRDRDTCSRERRTQSSDIQQGFGRRDRDDARGFGSNRYTDTRGNRPPRRPRHRGQRRGSAYYNRDYEY